MGEVLVCERKDASDGLSDGDNARLEEERADAISAKLDGLRERLQCAWRQWLYAEQVRFKTTPKPSWAMSYADGQEGRAEMHFAKLEDFISDLALEIEV